MCVIQTKSSEYTYLELRSTAQVRRLEGAHGQDGGVREEVATAIEKMRVVLNIFGDFLSQDCLWPFGLTSPN